MNRPANASVQTKAILRAFAANSTEWRYGRSLTQETGVKSGTLYPLLIRLADGGFLESKWLEPERPGVPPRHAYRLTTKGLALATEQAEPNLGSGARPLGAT